MSFLSEIRRRKVFQVATVYAVVAWILIQVVTAIEAPLNLPDWADTLVIVLLAVGFPVALILGWVFDLTPEGIAATGPEPTGTESSRQTPGQTFSYVTQAMVLLAVGFLVANEFAFDRRQGAIERAAMTDGAAPVNRFEIDLPAAQALGALATGAIAISPDGRRFAFASGSGIYLRSMDSIESRLIADTEGNTQGMTFTSDGQFVIFSEKGGLKRVSISGGTPLALPLEQGRQAAIYSPRRGPDDSILYYDRYVGIVRITKNGETERLADIAPDLEAYGPALLPGGEHVLLAVAPRGANSWDNSRIVAYKVSTGEQTVLIERGSDPRFVATGHIVYGFGGTIFAVAFDPASLTVTGTPVPLIQGVVAGGVGIDVPSHNFDVSADGTLVYITGWSPGRTPASLVWVDRDGVEQSLGFEPRIIAYPRLSPDGSRVAFATREGRTDIWVGDLARRSLTRLTVDGEGLAPVWSPDGLQLFHGGNRRIFRRAFDGSTAPESILDFSDAPATYYPRSISSDGSILLVSESEPPRDIGMFRIGGDRVQGLISTPTQEISPELSPDGRWLAYDSDESGRFEVYVRPFPDVGSGRTQVSIEGGRDPLFSRDGRALFFWSDPGTIMSVDIENDSDGSFAVGVPHAVVEGDYLRANVSRQYDVAADGSRFLVLKPVALAERQSARIMVVQNWLAEVQRLVQPQ